MCLGLALPVVEAGAEEAGSKPAAPEIKSVIGALAMYRPEYLGGDDHELIGLPFIDLQYNQYFFNPINGAGVGMRPVEALTVGLGLGYAFGRDQDDADRLEGLGDIDGGAKVSFFADYKFEITDTSPVLDASYTLGLTVDHQFTGDDTGVSGDLGFSRNDRLGERFMIINGVKAFFGSDAFQDAWFGISERQTLRSGLPVYDSDDVFHSAGVSTRLLYFVTRELNLITAVSYQKLIGDAGESPVVESQDQMSYQLGFSYAL
ncbi:MipA/OmpV family protein [Allohahella marinimesophila]|uniref:MipA/OmpV family protein n=1 Tax=Allohahella marinimesophila TaxID=1054972 RepID=A0ABP7QBI8_9GAMM